MLVSGYIVLISPNLQFSEVSSQFKRIHLLLLNYLSWEGTYLMSPVSKTHVCTGLFSPDHHFPIANVRSPKASHPSTKARNGPNTKGDVDS